ncbi:MAG: peptide chain release factor N(5)-glutamine methyltransferase, partial [Candidatus Doudnabacteria bacterium]|nr:peptide chain release factor N(5)-glutamine methyltransferase [Candidatus Doudnabacteria bacterium]
MTDLAAILERGIMLLHRHSDSPTLDAEVLLSSLIKKPKSFLLIHPSVSLSVRTEKKFFEMIDRRKTGMPLAYLLGKKEFYGRPFRVSPNALVPRPETEGLVELVLADCKAVPAPKPLRILDVGTGSGCIIITLCLELGAENFEFFGCDVSSDALESAKANAKLLGAAIHWKKSDLLEGLTGQFDVVAANLPYLTDKQFSQLRNKLRFEPKIALTDGSTNWRCIQKLLAQMPKFLNTEGKVYLEIEPTGKKLLAQTVKQCFPESRVNFFKDLTGANRYLRISGAPRAESVAPNFRRPSTQLRSLRATSSGVEMVAPRPCS